MVKHVVRILLGACLCAPAIILAAPYIPASGSQVVERLPGRTDPVQRELAAMRSALAGNPANLRLAVALAKRYIEQARADGDPRYLGYAQAALARWYTLEQPPSDVLVLRATLRQSTHQFGAALADLDTVLRRDPGNAQAWLTRATVQMVKGDHEGARASCAQLDGRAPPLVVQTCLSNVGSISGTARASYDSLLRALDGAPGADPALRAWALTLLAEMAARGGQAGAAGRHFRQALALDPSDSYLLAAYADFLLDRGHAPQVASLLRDKTRADALLLRYALALKAAHPESAAPHVAALNARFAAGVLRADTVHQREQARFELSLRGDAAAAVRLAKLNWAVQKEPADLRILVEAAAASGDREAARAALEWIGKSGIEDAALAPYLRQLKERT